MSIKPPPNSIHPKSRADWRMWLEENHARTEGIWLISYKKATGKPRLVEDQQGASYENVRPGLAYDPGAHEFLTITATLTPTVFLPWVGR